MLVKVVCGFVLALAIAFPPYQRLILPLLSSQPSEKLSFASTRLRSIDVPWIFLLLISRSIGQALAIWPSYGIKKIDENGPQTTLAVDGPQLKLRMPCSIGKEDIIAFAKAVHTKELSIADNASVLMLFLSAITEPAMLLLIAKKQCPIKPLGAVNVRNRFELLQSSACEELLAGKATGMEVVARLERAVRVKKRGYEFDVVIELVDGSAGSVAYRQIFTMLQFEKHGIDLSRGEGSAQGRSIPASPSTSEAGNSFSVKMGHRDPALWAALCKDYNPIHFSALAAKLFGIPGKIAHGNHVVAKAVEQASRSGVAGTSWQTGGKLSSRWMEAEFKRPVKVPMQLNVAARAAEGGQAVDFLELRRNEKVHVEVRSGKL